MLPDPASSSSDPSGPSLKLTSKTNSKLRETPGKHEIGLDMFFYSCSKCASTLYKSAPDGFPGVIIVFGGTLDGNGNNEPRAEEGLEALGVPEAELWVKYRLPWVKEVEGAKQCQAFE